MPEDYEAFQEICKLNKKVMLELRQNSQWRMNYKQIYKIERNAGNTKPKKAVDNISASIWLTKPFSSSCGRGIKLITEAYQIGRNSKLLVQEYLTKPYLIDGRKFDLRLYCVVTSFNPLIIYLFHDGLVRFSTKKFSKLNYRIHNITIMLFDTI